MKCKIFEKLHFHVSIALHIHLIKLSVTGRLLHRRPGLLLIQLYYKKVVGFIITGTTQYFKEIQKNSDSE